MQAAQDGDEVTTALAARLAAVTFTDRSAEAVTALLIDAVAGWAEQLGWRVYRRAASVVRLPPPMQHQHSVLDVAVARPAGPPLAIEVDHGSRKRTVEKLIAEGDAGRIPILVRWGGRKAADPPAPVRLIPVDVDQHPGGRFSRTALRPPPPHSGVVPLPMPGDSGGVGGSGSSGVVPLPMPGDSGAVGGPGASGVGPGSGAQVLPFDC
jgi:hypothetical protein